MFIIVYNIPQNLSKYTYYCISKNNGFTIPRINLDSHKAQANMAPFLRVPKTFVLT